MKQVFLFLIAVFSVFFLSGCSEPQEPVDILLNKALEKASSGDWKNADLFAGKVLKQNNKDVNALLIRALAYNSLDKRKAALDCALQAVEIAPNEFLTQYLKGLLLCNEGKYDLAIPALRAARSLRPGDANALLLLAKAAYTLKKYDAAAGYYSLLARHPQYKGKLFPLNAIGACYAHQDPRKSLAFFRAAYRTDPTDPVLALNMAVLYDQYMNQPDNARNFYDFFIRQTVGKLEYDVIRVKAELRLDSLKAR